MRLKLQEIVDAESKQHPYSDDELVKELEKHGLSVARRTVTKYRKAMKIPSSRQRRDWTITPDGAMPHGAAATADTAAQNGASDRGATHVDSHDADDDEDGV